MTGDSDDTEGASAGGDIVAAAGPGETVASDRAPTSGRREVGTWVPVAGPVDRLTEGFGVECCPGLRVIADGFAAWVADPGGRATRSTGRLGPGTPCPGATPAAVAVAATSTGILVSAEPIVEPAMLAALSDSGGWRWTVGRTASVSWAAEGSPSTLGRAAVRIPRIMDVGPTAVAGVAGSGAPNPTRDELRATIGNVPGEAPPLAADPVPACPATVGVAAC